jgi:hypothetical protein
LTAESGVALQKERKDGRFLRWFSKPFTVARVSSSDMGGDDTHRDDDRGSLGKDVAMLEPLVAGAFLLAATTVAALDTAPARAVLYALAQRRRRRRHLRLGVSDLG